jgi:hypothetical protein
MVPCRIYDNGLAIGAHGQPGWGGSLEKMRFFGLARILRCLYSVNYFPKGNDMLLDNYEKQYLLYNSNFKESAGAGKSAYRGDLVVVEGEIADSQGRRKPPVVSLVGAAVLAGAEKIEMLTGSLDDLSDITALLDRYQADFALDVHVMLFVVNIAKPMIVALDGLNITLLPMSEGMVWNELVDELGLEKSDFKGQSAGEKVVTVFEAFKGYKPKYETVGLDEALTRKIEAKRAIYGAV